MSVSEEDYITYLLSKYTLPILLLNEADITMRQEETRLNGNEKPTAENATMLTGKLKIIISIPFEGNSHFFHCATSEKISNFLKGEIQHQNRILQVSYEDGERDAAKLKHFFKRDIKEIKHILEKSLFFQKLYFPSKNLYAICS